MSMSCPKCQGKASCLDSRRRIGPSVTRRYECKVCKCRFSTCEIMVTIDGQAAPRTQRFGLATSMVERLESQALARGSI